MSMFRFACFFYRREFLIILSMFFLVFMWVMAGRLPCLVFMYIFLMSMSFWVLFFCLQSVIWILSSHTNRIFWPRVLAWGSRILKVDLRVVGCFWLSIVGYKVVREGFFWIVLVLLTLVCWFGLCSDFISLKLVFRLYGEDIGRCEISF